MPTDSLQLPLKHFKGVGPKLLESLSSMGLLTVEDILFHFPLRYQNKTGTRPSGGSREAHFWASAGLAKGAKTRHAMMVDRRRRP